MNATLPLSAPMSGVLNSFLLRQVEADLLSRTSRSRRSSIGDAQYQLGRPLRVRHHAVVRRIENLMCPSRIGRAPASAQGNRRRLGRGGAYAPVGTLYEMSREP